jgi:hypothetical protein
VLVAWKETGNTRLTAVLDHLLAASVVEHARGRPVVLVPVPTSRRSKRERGCDLVDELARSAARLLRQVGVEARVSQALTPARATADQVGFFTVPTSVTFTGPDNQTCASSISSEIFIFGGAPPYTISNSQPSAFFTNTTVVNFSGGSFRVTPSGICGNATFAVTNSAARTTTVTVTNELGSRDPPPAPLSVVPSSLNLNSCAASANAVIVGGQTTNYVAASSSGFVLATVTGSLLKVSRAPTTNVGLPPSGVTVTVSDGRSTFDVFVSLTGTALTGNPPGTGNCP